MIRLLSPLIIAQIRRSLTMIRNQELEQTHRIKLKALDEAFMHRIKEGTSCSRFECEAILEAVKDIYFPATIDSIKPGQMLFFAVSAKEPPNKPLNQGSLYPSGPYSPPGKRGR